MPCGKCVECTKKRQNDWKLRLLEECNNWNHLFFFTLTYSDESIPHSEYVNEESGEYPTTGRKSDIQSWLKLHRERYAREYGERLDMMYFITLEYAPDGHYVDRHGKTRQSTCRPHYHGLMFFNCDVNRIKPWFADWSDRFGFVKCSEIVPTDSEPDWREHRSKVCNYVAKYTAKGEFQSRIEDIENGLIVRPFLLCSKKIGSSYVERMRPYHLPFDNIGIDIVTTLEAVERDFNRDYGKALREKIKLVHLRSKVNDGTLAYKMPRYWRDRIYGYEYKQKRIIRGKSNLSIYVGSWNPECLRPFAYWRKEEPITTYSRTTYVKRYSHENWLSLALQYLVQCEFLTRSWELQRAVEQTIQEDDPKRKILLVDNEVLRRERAAQVARYNQCKGSLYNFYSNARFKTPELMMSQN